MEDQTTTLKRNIMAIGRLLWEKDLVTGLNGNISARLDEGMLLMTATKTCLGLLREEDILRINLEGERCDADNPRGVSTEQLLHTAVYRHFPEINAVVHTHTPYANAYFLHQDILDPQIFETRFVLGEVRAIPQTTPSVTDTGPVVEALRHNNIVVLKNHGVVAIGKDLFDCFLLIQSLEEAVKVDAISRLYQNSSVPSVSGEGLQRALKTTEAASPSHPESSSAFDLFSRAQMQAIVDRVNEDAALKALGEKTGMTMTLAVHMEETGQTYRFTFENGRITAMDETDEAEFLIRAPEKVWRAVFNRELDPFVATTQKKMSLEGDFARISRWYAPCSRIFELWQEVPIKA